jgi:large subunit ribosomal protein L4
MTVQKFINYKILNKDGTILSYESENKFELKIIEKSPNYLVHKDILRHQIHNKQGTISTKVKSEVRGGGRKPWRQKGTGRARAGSNRSPLWKGGGVIFGPKPKTTKIKLNKKERKLSLQTLLYNKRNNIFVINNLETILEKPKTSIFCNICENCGLSLNKKLLIVVSVKTKELKLATQNLKNTELILASNLNTFSLLKAEQILITPEAIITIKEIYCD